jgi:hypothetical protein
MERDTLRDDDLEEALWREAAAASLPAASGLAAW